MSLEQQLQLELAQQKQQGLLRHPLQPLPPSTLVICSNDYLGLSNEPLASGAAFEPPLGAGASRLISGTQASHVAAESALADWLGFEAALLFSSGYAANVGALAALAGPGDVVVSDRLNHASIIDGCRLQRGAKLVVTDHGSLDQVAAALSQHPTARRRIVAVESYYSMDGTSPDLVGLRRICDAHNAFLYVDEAHALGVFGAEGRGLCAARGIQADLVVATLGKSFGVQGACVASSETVRHYLWNRARSFVFSTAVSPWMAEAVRHRLKRVRCADTERKRLARHAERFRQALRQAGWPISSKSHGPIIPLLVGDANKALRMSQKLLAQGVFVQAIRPPTVPEGSSRLRISLHASLSDEEREEALSRLCDPSLRGLSPGLHPAPDSTP